MTIQSVSREPLPSGNAARRVDDQAKVGGGRSFANLVKQTGEQAVAQTALPEVVRVKKGDTLIGIIKDAAAANGRTASGADAWRIAQQVAQHNGLRDVNLIYPDQKLALKNVHAELAALPEAKVVTKAPQTPAAATPAPAQSTQAALALRMAQGLSAPSLSRINTAGHVPPMHTPVLDKTLQRAVEKGFIAFQEIGHVKAKIARMAQKYNFQPDDFARLTLMESDGMNPQASNGSCHGIIQFCDGDDRGAASVGFAQNPRAILGLSAVAQLDLVDKYFSDVGVGKNGRERLDDLYLSVLTPNARNEKRRHVPLDISGQQAAYLHVGRDQTRPITRQSIWTGLVQNANERLRTVNGASANPPAAARSWKVSAYNSQQ